MDKVVYTSNSIDKEYNFVMAYPEKEEFALSSLGYMWLYKIADTIGGINAQRVSKDFLSFPFKNTDAVGFSMSFDFDFAGVFEILEKNNIPLFSKEQKKPWYPLIRNWNTDAQWLYCYPAEVPQTKRHCLFHPYN